MAQPTPYTRQYDFSDYQTVNPSKPLRGSEVDAEFDAVKLTTDQLRANIGLIQRDDGELANRSVTPESLSAGAMAMIHQGEYTPRGGWAATVDYELSDVVDFNTATYLCIVPHTSTASFATDKADGNWMLMANGAIAGEGSAVNLFVGNGTQTVFTLSYNYRSSNGAIVFVSGVAQIPDQDFTIVGTTLTFASAPPAPSVPGRDNVMARGTSVGAQLAADMALTASADAQGFSSTASISASSALTSENSAAASETAAATSATNAASSASGVSASASTATTQATSATNSATAAAASQSAAATSATNASTSATTAGVSATTSTTQATNAVGSATAAANSVTSAAGSATSASNSASTASGAASTATTQASNASTSATAAGQSATNAVNSASTASTSASNAVSSASSASSSASSANTSAVNAAASAAAAAISAATSSTQATNAAGSASAASGSATSAASAQTAAESARDATLAAYDSFDDRYLGAKTSNPTVDNDGNALVAGALYFNSVSGSMQLWTGSAWVAAYVSGSGYLAAANDLSDVANASTARTNLGLAIGADVLAYDSNLQSFVAAFTLPIADGAANYVLMTDGSGTLGFAVAATGDVTLAGTQTLTNKTISDGVYSGSVDQTGSVRGGLTAVAALDIDCSQGNFFTKTISTSGTFTFSNAPSSRSYSFTLELTQDGGAVTWPATVRWPNNIAPFLSINRTNLFMFVTDDGGTIWRGASLVNYFTT